MSLKHTRHALGLLALLMLTAGGSSVAAGQRFVPGDARLVGTYELESNRSDDPQRAADEATRGLSEPQRGRVYR